MHSHSLQASCLQATCLGLPHEPDLEGVAEPAAHDSLVPDVIGGVIVELVLHEEVAGVHRVAGRQEAGLLQDEGRALQGEGGREGGREGREGRGGEGGREGREGTWSQSVVVTMT